MTIVLCVALATHAAQTSPTLSQTTLRLIEDWRKEAEKLISSHQPVGAARVSLLMDLLDRGNRIMEQTGRETAGAQGVGEGFGEAYSTIFGELWTSGDRNDQHVLDVLVRGAYNEDSPFAVEIARGYGERIAPTLLELVQSDFHIHRITATRMLGTLLQNSRLPSTTRDRVHTAIVNAASDANPGVRISAVTTLGRVGTPVDMTILQRIAGNDPESKLQSDGVRRYPVREAAQRAVAEIQKR
jgi:hypothetical protein